MIRNRVSHQALHTVSVCCRWWWWFGIFPEDQLSNLRAIPIKPEVYFIKELSLIGMYGLLAKDWCAKWAMLSYWIHLTWMTLQSSKTISFSSFQITSYCSSTFSIIYLLQNRNKDRICLCFDHSPVKGWASQIRYAFLTMNQWPAFGTPQLSHVYSMIVAIYIIEIGRWYHSTPGSFKYSIMHKRKQSKSKTKASVKCRLAPKWHFRVSLRNVKDSSSPSYCLLEASSPSITGNPEWVDSLAEAPTCPLAIWTNRRPLRGNPTICQILYFDNLLSMRY